MGKIVYILFLVIMCIIYTQISKATLSYGVQLRDLRGLCKSIIEDYNSTKSFPRSDKSYVLIDNTTNKPIHQNPDTFDHDEFMRLMNNSETGKITFQHAPDMHDTSHIIATYKETNDNLTCITFINT